MAVIKISQEYFGEWSSDWGVSSSAQHEFRKGKRPIPWARVVNEPNKPAWVKNAIVAQAIAFAIAAHKAYDHTLKTTGFLKGWNCPPEIVAAGALYVVRNRYGMATTFGREIANLVHALSDDEIKKVPLAQMARDGNPATWVAIAAALSEGQDVALGWGATKNWREHFATINQSVVKPFSEKTRKDGNVTRMRDEWNAMYASLA